MHLTSNIIPFIFIIIDTFFNQNSFEWSYFACSSALLVFIQILTCGIKLEDLYAYKEFKYDQFKNNDIWIPLAVKWACLWVVGIIILYVKNGVIRERREAKEKAMILEKELRAKSYVKSTPPELREEVMVLERSNCKNSGGAGEQVSLGETISHIEDSVRVTRNLETTEIWPVGD